jgi:NAD+ synthase
MELRIDPAREAKKILAFIQGVLQKTGKNNVVVACSGGIDSSTVASLTVRAVGVEHAYFLLLPYGELYPSGMELAKQLFAFLRIPKARIFSIDISPIVNKCIEILAIPDEQILRRGNIMARVRMIVMYDFAKRFDALVSGTENKSEYYLGYFTRFGDEASDFEPIRHLYKTQVYQLAEYLGIPEKIRIQQPTAGLWHGQTDKEELGFSYEEADRVLYAHFEKGVSLGTLELQGLKNARKILSYVARNYYKHEVPYDLNIVDSQEKV